MISLLLGICVVALAALYVVILRASLLLGCVALLVLGCCAGPYFLSVRTPAATLTLDRAAAAALTLAYVLQCWRGRTEPKPVVLADVTLAALLAALTLSMFTADWLHDAPGSTKPWWHLYAGYLLPTVLYWVARQSVLDARQVRRALGLLVAFAIYLSLTGIFEVTQQWWLVFPRYMADPDIGLAFGCARGPMLQPVTFGLYVATGALCALVLCTRVGGAWWFAALPLPLFLIALFLTYTRATWLGAALGLGVVCVLTAPRRWRAWLAAGLAATGLLLVTTQWDSLLGFARGRYDAAYTRWSAYTRLSFAYVSWHMFLDHPWEGVHFGHFETAKLPYLDAPSTTLDLESIRPYGSHNTLFTVLVETGVGGFALLAALLGAWVRTAWQLSQDPRVPDSARMAGTLLLGTLAVYTGSWLFHELTYTPMDHGLLFVLAGITVGLRASGRAANARAGGAG